ncbi:MAG TPA: helix-turn-helix domain-containing protein [Candidatus Lachnoclostridium avicola]|nr:helix-turn-helix domain-containing protein [Candidatus Lachnoclostridium avicola]
MYEYFQRLLDKYGVTAYKVAKETGISTVTLTNWKRGRYTPKPDKLQKIADYFGVPLSYLLTGKMEEEVKDKSPELTRRDERDIEKILDQTRDQLLSQDGLMFDGQPATPEAIDSILSAMQIGMELAKKKNKEKYTPKKYKKD